MELNCGPIRLDLSRQPEAALSAIPSHETELLSRIGSWLAGDPVNETEGRAAMHMALRAQDNSLISSVFIDPVRAERERQKLFVESCSASHILHIGVGGSDLGPRLVYEALQGHGAARKKQATFLSSLTPDAIARAASSLDPKETLVVVASKSFKTAETSLIIQIFTDTFSWPKNRIVASTTKPEVALAMGIPSGQVFPFWDWVGGRYSVWSSVGLSLALAYGWDYFHNFLAGAAKVDAELYNDIENSAPWRLATVWHTQRNIFLRPALSVLPYHADLGLLPAYLQQLVMESNGKPAKDSPAPIVFGASGTEFQHSFGQFLHQGPDLCTNMFITVEARETESWRQRAQANLLANAYAQADILWSGQPNAEEPHKALPGGRPSVVLALPDLSPYSLGALLALFEHTTVIDGFMSDINPFDQWGVEAGKLLAQKRLTNGS